GAGPERLLEAIASTTVAVTAASSQPACRSIAPLSCASRTTPRARIEIPAPRAPESGLLTVGGSPPADLPLDVLLLLVMVVVDAMGIDLVWILVRGEHLPELDIGIELQGGRTGER